MMPYKNPADRTLYNRLYFRRRYRDDAAFRERRRSWRKRKREAARDGER